MEKETSTRKTWLSRRSESHEMQLDEVMTRMTNVHKVVEWIGGRMKYTPCLLAIFDEVMTCVGQIYVMDMNGLKQEGMKSRTGWI